MSKSLRLSEKWFRRGLWLVAVVFAGFLIGLGGTVVGDLPKVEQPLTRDDFIDRPAADRLREGIKAAESTQREAQQALEQAELALRSAQADVASATGAFNAWIATRSSTQRSEENPEVLARTRELERLQQAQRKAQSAVEGQDKIALDARQSEAKLKDQLSMLEGAASDKLRAEQRKVELRVFLYRLALTLPLLAIAAWLFVKKRKGTYWPFVWGFIFFAGFAFFVELVPYMPSYGGYVRYVVGILLTVVIGRYAILALNAYLERQKREEQLPDVQRRETLAYDTALARLAKNVCPGCERPVDLKDDKIDFCAHCGIGLFNRCRSCSTRKSAFAKYCFACGASAMPAEQVAARTA